MGIAVGMTASVLILYFVRFETSYDSFHRDACDLYRVELDTYRDGILESKSALTAPAVGQSLHRNFPEVESVARIASNPGKVIISYNNTTFRETKAYLADSSVFRVFTFEWLAGDQRSLFSESHDLIISENLARKIGGPRWKQLVTSQETIDLSSQGIAGSFKITGVFKNLPANSHFKPELIAPRSYLISLVGNAASDESWDFNFFYTYIKLRNESLANSLLSKFNSWVEDNRKEALQSVNARLDFHLQPVTDIHLRSDIQFEMESNGDIRTVYAMGVIGILILIIAWINFINLSTARSIKRAKEVGVRKVFGASRGQLMKQFVVESIALNLMAILISCILVALCKPKFAEISAVPFSFMNLGQLFSSPAVVLSIIVILASGILLSGLYPAFILSGFNPVTALKANSMRPKGMNIRKVLVLLQSTLSLIMISGTFIVYRQVDYMRKANLGIDIHQTLVIEAPENLDNINEGARHAFKSQLLNHSFVKGITMTSVVPGQEVTFRSYNLTNENTSASINSGIIGIDHDFIKHFSLQLIAGHDLSDLRLDPRKVILNEEACRQLGFNSPEEAIGAELSHENKNGKEFFKVGGVVKNYHHRSLRSAIEPIIFMNGRDLVYYCLKLEEKEWEQFKTNINTVANEFKSAFPANHFDYFFLDQKFDSQYQSEEKFGTVFLIFSSLAVIISSLGLLGLSTFITNLRNNEIGIRKVLGATTSSIAVLLLKEYFLLWIFSIVIATPTIYFYSRDWLGTFAFKMNVGPWVFAAPAIILLVITMLTVGIQSLAAAGRNPTDTIRAE